MEVVAFWLEFQQRVVAKKWLKHSVPAGAVLGRIGMYKSALLGRLMRGEEIRRRPCPRHKGQMWCFWGLDEAARPCACDGTGWLPNEAPQDNPPPDSSSP